MADITNTKYINWLRCASSLAELKQNLHTYTKDGVIRLHENIKRNVIIDLGSSFQCTSNCSWNGIEKHHSRWSISCRTCNAWLQQILRKHRKQESNTINWCNSNIIMWSTEPWEIAKIFLPKGQWYNANLPEELDIAALLSLHKYCKEFDHEILASDMIAIRNTLFHSSALSVDETDKNEWIDRMLEFLSRLNINGNARRAIEKLKTEDATFPKERQLVQQAVSELEIGMKAFRNQLESFETTQKNLLSEVENNRGRGNNNEALTILQERQEQLEIQLQEHRNQERSVYSPVISRLHGVAEDNPNLIETIRLKAAIEEIKSLRDQLQKNETIFSHLKNLLAALWARIISCFQQ